MPVQRVSVITLGVADLAVSRKFYGDMGWVPRDEVPGKVIFYQIAGSVFGLFPHDELAKDQGREGATLGTGAITLAHNHRSEAEVDAAYTKAIAAGATALKAPEKTFWGGYAGYYADPDGHPWEVAFNPFWDLDDEGRQILPDPTETA
ncbi:VOC family protein [Yoonia sp. 208BN28-4]|uniref:VOC family protein n=1 Tax=Yoonia sp. 208BN28-4 TaxID=3126505 RepID=UPI0030B08401